MVRNKRHSVADNDSYVFSEESQGLREMICRKNSVYCFKKNHKGFLYPVRQKGVLLPYQNNLQIESIDRINN